MKFSHSVLLTSIAACACHVWSLDQDQVMPSGFNNLNALDYFYPQDKSHLKSDTYKFLEYPVDQIWHGAGEVSENVPFIFFHQRHAGGTNLKTTLAEAAKKSKLSSHIACVNVPCNSFGVPTNGPRAVYAEHMQWGEQNNFNRFNGVHHRSKFSCMTNFREPISRLINCIYAEFEEDLHDFNAQCIADLDDHILTQIIAESVDDYGNSCLNEPFRIMSGMRDEGELDTLGIVYNETDSTITSNLKPFDVDVIEMTLSHLEKCAPVILENPRSFELMQLKVPKLYQNGAFTPMEVTDPDLIIPESATKCGPPTASQMEILQRFTAAEKILYDTVVRVVDKGIAELLVKK